MPKTRNILLAAFLGALVWGLLNLGGVGTRGFYYLFLWILAVALAATWTLPMRWPSRWIAVAALAGSILFALRLIVEPPLTGRGYVLAALGVTAYLCCRWIAAGDRRSAQLLVWGLVAIGALEACWGLLQPRPISGTLGNPNHFAGFLNMTLGLALGCLHGAWRSRPMVGLFGVAAVLMGLGVVASGSRGGVAVLLLTLAFAALLVAFRRIRTGRSAVGWIATALLVAAVFGFGAQRLLSRADVSDVVRRLTIYQDTAGLIADHPLAGVGAGMYAWHFRPYQTFDTEKRFDHAHNDFLEVAAEWGIPIAALLFLFFVWQVAASAEGFLADRSEASRGRGLHLGIAAGALSILAHGMVDFPLQIPVNLLTFAMILGLSRAGLERSPAEAPGEAPGGPRDLRVVLSVLLIAAGIGAGRQLLATETGRRALDAEDLEQTAGLDPAWPLFHFRVGILHRDLPEYRDLAAAKRSLERAVELNPYSWRYRFGLARFYESAGALDLAEGAYMAALERNPRSTDYLYRVAGFFLRRGDSQRGLILLRRALVADEELLTPGAELLSLTMSPGEIVRWWPRHGAARRVLVEVLSRDVAAASGGALEDAWRDWLEAVPPPSIAEGGFYVDRLLAASAVAEARRAWIALTYVNGLLDEDFVSRRNDLWNGGFDHELTGGELGWRFPEAGGTRVGRAPVGKGGGWSLYLEFFGEKEFRRVRQRAVVDPATSYDLRFVARCESLVAPEGVRLQVLDVASREVLFTSAPLAATMGWTRFEGTFDTAGPEVLVRLAVPAGDDGSRMISGRLWLDSMALHRSDMPGRAVSPSDLSRQLGNP